MSGLVKATVLAASFAACAAHGSTASSLDFDKVFDAPGAPAQSHYAATYRIGGSDHRVEVWRDRDLLLRRATDDALETIVTRPSGSVEWTMTVLDLKRKIRTDVDRSNLYRIGNFTDWFGLAHSLTRPTGPYQLTSLEQNQVPSVSTLAPCRWYALRQGDRTSKICWSAVHRVPITITDDAGRVQWAVTTIDRHRQPAKVFEVDDRGFVHNDANQDIKAD